MLSKRRCLLALLIVAFTGFFSVCLPGHADSQFWPFWTETEDSPVSENKTEIRSLGPIVEYNVNPDADYSMAAVRPLWSREVNEESWAQDILWPVAISRDNWFWKFHWVTLFYTSTDKTTGLGRWYFIPLWFSGYNDNREFFWAFFPAYGNAYNLIGYDRMRFVLFPCYWETEKNGTYGESYLWPIVNWDTGPRSDKLRVFPFYAYNNVYGSHYAESYLWPLFHRVYSLNENKPGYGWMFWPLIGHNEWPDRNSWSCIWPLFEYTTAPQDGFSLNCPWPIVQYQRNIPEVGDSRRYLFPLLGARERKDSTYYFVLWPCFSYLEDRGEDKTTQWLWLLPLYWTKSSVNKDGDRVELYRRFWPFASYYEDKQTVCFRALDWWPERNMRVIDRNWAPLWTLFSYLRTDLGVKGDVLWGLVRWYETKDRGKRFSFFPFYESNYDLPSVAADNPFAPKVVEGETAQEDAQAPEAVRDILLGTIRVSSYADSKTSWRVLWLLEF